jgi:uncharacterized OB-fold protein
VKCETCSSAYFPKRQVYTKCRRKGKIIETQFSGKGKVFSYTEVTAPPEGFEDQVPYVLAIVELDEGARLTAQIVDAQKEDVKIGSQVEQVFRIIQSNDPEGLVHYGFKFKLV